MADPLLVFAPGSLVPAQAALRDGFAAETPGGSVRFHPPAYSGLLARQILAGAPADVFISAGWRYLEELQRAGLVPRPLPIAGNRLAIVARPELAATIRDARDLARPGLRLLVPPAETDPLGQYAAESFAAAGVAAAIAAKRARGEVADRLSILPDALAAGQVDAAVVYATAVEALRPVATPIALEPPFDLRHRIRFGAGAVVRDGRAHPAAQPFVDFLAGPTGQALLARAGFLPPPPAA